MCPHSSALRPDSALTLVVTRDTKKEYVGRPSVTRNPSNDSSVSQKNTQSAGWVRESPQWGACFCACSCAFALFLCLYQCLVLSNRAGLLGSLALSSCLCLCLCLFLCLYQSHQLLVVSHSYHSACLYK